MEGALNVYAGSVSVGLVGIATEGLRKLDASIAVGILDKVISGRSAFSFGVRIDGECVEIVANVVDGLDSMHLATITIPTPTFEALG